MKDNSKLAYNITDAAEYLAVSKSFVYMLRKKEIIKAIKVGRNYIFPLKELDNFIKRCKEDEQYLYMINEEIKYGNK